MVVKKPKINFIKKSLDFLENKKAEGIRKRINQESFKTKWPFLHHSILLLIYAFVRFSIILMMLVIAILISQTDFVKNQEIGLGMVIFFIFLVATLEILTNYLAHDPRAIFDRGLKKHKIKAKYGIG